MPKSTFALLFLFGLFSLQVAAQKPIRIATDLWTGSGILYLAQEQGLFEEAGLNIQLVWYDDYAQTVEAFKKGEVDAVQMDICAAVEVMFQGKDYTAIFTPTDNIGFDEIIAQNEIKTLEQLKGKKIGYEPASIGHYLLNRALTAGNLTKQDIKAVHLTPKEAKKQFEDQKIDAAATLFFFRPDIGQTIYSSYEGEYGLPNVFAFNRDLAQSRRSELIKFLNVWQKTVNYYRTPKNFTASRALIRKKLKIKDQSLLHNLQHKAPELDLYECQKKYFNHRQNIQHIALDIIEFHKKNTDWNEAKQQKATQFQQQIDRYFDDSYLNATDYISTNQNIQAKDTLTLGVVNYIDEALIKHTYGNFINYIADKFDAAPKLVIKDYDYLTGEILQNKVDIGVYNPNEYLQASDKHPEIKAFASHGAYDNPTYTSVIIVRKDAGIESIEQLKGKRFYFVNKSSTSGYKLPVKFFNELGIHNFGDFFKNADLFSGQHKTSIELLKNNKADGIATYKEAIEQYELDSDLFTILKEQTVPYNAYVFSPKLNKKTREKLKTILFEAADVYKNETDNIFYKKERDEALAEQTGDSKHKKLGIQAWFPVIDDYYNNLRAFLGYKRIKPNLNFKFDIELSNPQAANLLRQKIRNAVTQTNRFVIVDSEVSAYNLTIEIKQAQVDDPLTYYTVKIDNTFLTHGDMETEILRTHLPDLIVSKILNSFFKIKDATLKNLHKEWFINYGSEDGLNKHYVFFYKGKVLKPFIRQNKTVFKSDELFKDGGAVDIVYQSPEHHLHTKHSSHNEDKWSLSNLDFVSIILTIFGAAITGLIWYFQSVKERRFKRMRHEANGLLKEYLEGKAVDEKLFELSVLVGDMLERRHIKETHYNILNTKVNEISNLLGEHFLIQHDEIRAEIEAITADGIITENEYRRLLAVVRKHLKRKI